MLHKIEQYCDLNERMLMDIYSESNFENTDYFFPDEENKELAVQKVETGFLDFLKNEFFLQNEAAYWIFEENGVWYSALRTCKVPNGPYYLEALETRPDFRGEGYASLLLSNVLDALKENGPFRICDCVSKKNSFQGDATELSQFPDDSFDATLCFGSMYHLYETDEVNRAIDEAIRVTKPNGVILFAFLSVYAILYANYFYGNWAEGQAENFTTDHRVRHFKEQLFTGYDVTEFEGLFYEKPVEWITTAGVDGLVEPIEKRPDFSMTDEEFKAFAEWYLTVSEKRELLGATSHLLYICRKQANLNGGTV